MWGSASPQRAPSQAERAMTGVSPTVIRRRIASLLAVDESTALGRIQVPTLVLKALRDRVISRAATRWILKTLPSAQLAEIDGPHLLLQTRPAECAAVVLRFMRDAAGPDRFSPRGAAFDPPPSRLSEANPTEPRF
jgi:pimeloyl-ACP methyl ester carboxylesterase